MNIEFIKSEFEKLSLILRTWDEGESISAIERDIALDKLKNIYDTLRFGEAAETNVENETQRIEADAERTPVAPPATETVARDEPAESPSEEDENETPAEEEEVEVEFIFADEDEEDDEATEAAPAAEPEPAEYDNAVADDEPRSDAAAETPSAESTPATAEPEAEERPQELPRSEESDDEQPARRPLNSLFGADEIGSRPRTKHHRMMSIYNDARPREEKVIDISKIFDADEDMRPQPMPSPRQTESVDERTAPVAEEHPIRMETPAPRPAASPAVEPQRADDASHPVTLGDAINRNAQTLADTLGKPSALAEEITHTKITSLREAIGINDKFLMIRDLFDGDGEAYDEAIGTLDGFDSLDDCMIHIVENYSWNPDSEGAKFIMQLLERKLS